MYHLNYSNLLNKTNKQMFKVIFYQKRIREKIQKYINMIDFGPEVDLSKKKFLINIIISNKLFKKMPFNLTSICVVGTY